MPSFTITFSAAQATRIQAAYSEGLPEGQAAGVAEVKADAINHIKRRVHSFETQQAAAAAANAVVPMDDLT